MREAINAIQSLPEDQIGAINNHLEEKCEELQAKVNKMSESYLRSYEKNKFQVFDLIENEMVQQGMDSQTANGFIQLYKKLADESIKERKSQRTTYHSI